MNSLKAVSMPGTFGPVSVWTIVNVNTKRCKLLHYKVTSELSADCSGVCRQIGQDHIEIYL